MVTSSLLSSSLELLLKFLLVIIIFSNSLVHGLSTREKRPAESVFQWKTVAYGPINKSEHHLVADYPYFVRENIIPTAIAYHAKTSMLFIAAPRLRPGVISTLNSLDLYETYHLTSPIWTPYPSLEINELQPWHFPRRSEDHENHGHEEYQEGDDCEDRWKKGPGFCQGYYEDDKHQIPHQYLPDEFLDRYEDEEEEHDHDHDHHHRYRSKRSRSSTVMKIRISSTFPENESLDTEEEEADLDNSRIGLRNVRKLKSLISVNSLMVDQCDRLWFIDTGMLDYGDQRQTTVHRPSLWVVDVSQKDLFLVQRRFEFDREIVASPTGLRGLSVDIKDNDCSTGVAYIANALDHRIVVYDMRRDDAWFLADKSMETGPISAGYLHFPEMNLEAHLGVTDVAVGWRNGDRDEKSLYYMSYASHDLFVVSTGSLKRRNRRPEVDEFKFIGSRGRRSQSESMTFDSKRGILFFAEAQTRSVKCWNVKEELRRENIGTVFEHKNLDYPAHLSIDGEGNLWVLSNRMPNFLQFSYSHDKYNIHLYRIVIKEAIKESGCE